MATKKSATNSKRTKKTSSSEHPKVKMLIIPEHNLTAVYSWLESERMTMPYNETRACLKLLAAAKPFEE